MTNHRLVAPSWRNLPSDHQKDFRRANFEKWYKDPRNNDANRLTLINCYWKMKPAGLWRYVNAPAEKNPQRMQAGHLEFTTRNPTGLQSHLSSRSDFSSPTWSLSFWNTNWDSREKTRHAQLHLKNFPGWPKNRVQAHVDPAGFVWSDPTTIGSHLSGSQKEVLKINRLLRAHGHGSWFNSAVQSQTKTRSPRPIRTFTDKMIVSQPYKVKYGDRLWNLAGNFGYANQRQFISDFKKFNPGVNPHHIYAGRKYQMPFMTGSGTKPVGGLSVKSSSSLTSTSYKVNRGDTLWKLAPNFGYQNKQRFVNDFKKLNQGVNPNRIYAGRNYVMPFKSKIGPKTGLGISVKPTSFDRSSSLISTSYKVNRGDTLWKLAPKFGYNNPRRFVNEFKKLNPGVNPNRIYTNRMYQMPFQSQSVQHQHPSFLRQLSRGL
jgi:LysM repeat protein